MAKRPDLNGLRIAKTDVPGEKIYLIDLGMRRWIPGPNTYNELFRDWSGVKYDIDVEEIDEGPIIPIDAILLWTAENNKLYLLDDLGHGKMLRWITSPDVMERYHFSWEKPRRCNVPRVAFVDDGPSISNPPHP